jgi:hypothetical protein
MTADLSSIKGITPKRRAVLAESLNIRTPGDLVRADRRTILDEMKAQRLRLTLEEISTWQDEARDLAAAGDPGWEQVAAFVVSFEKRDTEHGLERRVAAEQAEHEPPVPHESWPDWPGAAVSAWMQRHLPARQTEDTDAIDVTPADEPSPPAAEELESVTPSVAAGTAVRPSLTIDVVELVIPGQPSMPLGAGTEEITEAPSGARLRVTTSGAASGQEVNVALRVRRPGRPSLTPHSPATTTGNTPVEIDLSALSPGTHTSVLAAWTDDGSAAPAVRHLPTLQRQTPT